MSPKGSLSKRLLRSWLFRGFAIVVMLSVIIGGIFTMSSWEAMGSRPGEERLAKLKGSPQWSDGKFRNELVRHDGSYWKMTVDYIRGVDNTSPVEIISIVERTAQDFANPPASGLRITWLGHSTSLVEIDGKRFLLDPVWADRAAPMSWTGPKRFHAPPLPLDELPELDGVLISHDHFDHLDHETVKALGDRVPLYFVPLGVGSHLEYWGVPAERIVELDWWGEAKVGEVTLVATPARHFSGRSLLGMDKTLWAGWALVGPSHRVFYSGDTAMFPGFKDIGSRLGPFDATLLDSGAYSALWADVHLGPEQAVVAHQMVRGGLLIPVHWGGFDLALHAWTEPAERVLSAAKKTAVSVAIPRPGQSIEPSMPTKLERWWPEIPWSKAEQTPVTSSGLDETLEARVHALTTDVEELER